MRNQTKFGFILAWTVLFALPGDAMAGFGLFKRCRPRVVQCLTPGVSQPCPPAVCQPCPPVNCQPCEEVTKEVAVTYWYAVGSGMNLAGTCSFVGECEPSPSAAIASAMANANGCSPYAYVLHVCAGPGGRESIKLSDEAADAPDQPIATSDLQWRGYVTALNPADLPVVRRTPGKYDSPEKALAATENLVGANWSVLNYIIRAE